MSGMWGANLVHWFWRATIGVVVAFLTICPLGGGLQLAFNHLGARTHPSYDRIQIGLSLTVVVLLQIVCLAVYGLFTRRYYRLKGLGCQTRCRKCGCILRGITEPRCSECGERI